MKRIQKKFRSVLCLGTESSDEKAEKLQTDVPEVPIAGLGATIPPELFFNILRWVSRNDTRRETYARLRRGPVDKKKSFETRVMEERQEIIKAGPAYTLRSCSLVCVYWAIQCREYMFRGARLNFSSLQKAQSFRKYSTVGSKRLVPISVLIRSIDVEMTCNRTPRSFIDVVYLPQMRGKLDTLKIFGPLPQHVAPSKLDTPHWSVTNLATLPPSATAYRYLVITAVDFPSFRHLVKYFKYFDSAIDYHLYNITWSGKTPSSPFRFPKPLTRSRRSIAVYVSRCTDDFALCIQISMMYPDFPLRAVSSQDEVLMFHLMSVVGGFYRNTPQTADEDAALQYRITYGSGDDHEGPEHYVSLTVLNIPRNFVDISVQFYGEDRSTPSSSIESGRTPFIRTRIVAIIVSIRSRADLDNDLKLITIDLNSLQPLIQQHRSPLAVIITFANYRLLELFVTRYPTLLVRDEGRMPIFMCSCSDKHPVPEGLSEGELTEGWTQVDDTMKATVKQWPSWEDAFSEILANPTLSPSPSMFESQ